VDPDVAGSRPVTHPNSLKFIRDFEHFRARRISSPQSLQPRRRQRVILATARHRFRPESARSRTCYLLACRSDGDFPVTLRDRTNARRTSSLECRHSTWAGRHLNATSSLHPQDISGLLRSSCCLAVSTSLRVFRQARRPSDSWPRRHAASDSERGPVPKVEIRRLPPAWRLYSHASCGAGIATNARALRNEARIIRTQTATWTSLSEW